MKRTVVAIGLAVAALALLASLVLQSRSVPIEAHVAHYSAATELERVIDDYQALVGSLQSAWQATQAPGEGARALLERLEESPQRLQEHLALVQSGTSEQNRVRNSFDGFRSTVLDTVSLAGELFQEQTAYAENVTFIRETGPRLVQQMRDIRLDSVAADTFQLVVGALDYARANTDAEEYELRRLLVSLGRDQRIDANMPGQVSRLRDAVSAVLDGKPSIRSKLEQLATTPVPTLASNLHVAEEDLYRNTSAAADRARMMLAVYSVLLLAAAVFVAYRLHSSYRELNRANSELAVLNQSLEQRVAERTTELEGALRNLKESQVQLVQAEKMSSLGQLVAGISHEINTPLLYLANNALLIQERLELMSAFVKQCLRAFALRSEEYPDRAEFQAKFVDALKSVKLMLRNQEIEASVEEARDLVQDSISGLNDLTEIAQSLKDFSRLDRAPVGSFSVNAGLDKTLLIAKNVIKHKATVRKFYGDLPEIQCSPSQVNQVFLNLLTNAAQAIENQGEIVVTTKLHDAEHVAITIADTGCGISPEHLSKIRDPFFTTKEVGSGTGLGLSIVDEIVRGHNGQLLVESEVGKGSAFTVVLPIKHTPAATAERAQEHEEAGDLSPGMSQWAEAI